MGIFKPLFLAGVLVCLSISINPAMADGWFFLDPIELEAEIRFEGSSVNTTTESSGTAYKRTTLLLEEHIVVGLNGYIVDPRISNFSIKVAPVFRQGREKVDDSSDGTTGNNLDYNIGWGFCRTRLAR